MQSIARKDRGWRRVTDLGKLVEKVRYSSYGTPFGLPTGDTDSDGDNDATDQTAMFIGTPYNLREDADLDGDNDLADITHASSITGSYQTLGRTVLSSTGVKNRKGYAGYEQDHSTYRLYHVRHRVMNTTLGRWTRRDPLQYVDGPNTYAHARLNPVGTLDPLGTQGIPSIYMRQCDSHDSGAACGIYSCNRQTYVENSPCIGGRGILVQKVTVSYFCLSCPPLVIPGSGELTYFERIPDAGRGAAGGRSVEQFACDHFAQIYQCAPSMGIIVQRGEQRYFCLSDFHFNDPTSTWLTGQSYFFPMLQRFGTTICTCTAPGWDATTFPSQQDQPLWWDGVPHRLSISRDASTMWYCCGDREHNTWSCNP